LNDELEREMERSGLGPRHYPNIFLERLRKTRKISFTVAGLWVEI
jgi:hypothetical protein